MGKIRDLIAFLESAVNEGHIWKLELHAFLFYYKKTCCCTTGKELSSILIFRVVKDNLSTVLSTADCSRHNDAVKPNHTQKQKRKLMRRQRCFSQTYMYKRR